VSKENKSLKGGNVEEMTESKIPLRNVPIYMNSNDTNNPFQSKKQSQPFQTNPQAPFNKTNAQQNQTSLLTINLQQPPQRPPVNRTDGFLKNLINDYTQPVYAPVSMNQFPLMPDPMHLVQKPNSNIINYNIVRHNEEPFEIQYGMKRDGVILDELPSKVSHISITDRELIYNIVYSSYFRSLNGNEQSLKDVQPRNLFKAIKLLDINPYIHKHGVISQHNPYEQLNYGFILYRSCYPIQLNERTRKIGCSSNSLGMNIKLYMLTQQDEHVMRNPNSFQLSHIWNEIYFYEYCYNNILRPKVCPHFPFMYGYFIGTDSKLDFDKIYSKGHSNHVSKHKLIRAKLQKPDTNETNKKEDCKNSNGKVLLAFTEGYNYNLYSWASKHYEQKGNIKKMIYNGFYQDHIWSSILFQIMVGLYVMQKKNFCINDFDPMSHIYIKEMEIIIKPSKYWKYMINNMEYYLPNYGFLVLFDSNYKNDSCNNVLYNNVNNTNICYNMFLSIIEPSKYLSGKFVDMEGIIPKETHELLTAIYTEATTSNIYNIGYYIEKYMCKYLNNRIGTSLDEKEMSSVQNVVNPKQYKVGKIYIEQKNTNEYRFVLLKSISNSKASIITNVKTYNTEDVLLYNLYEYQGVISQTYQTVNLNESINMIEQYQI
jgi:hypothetical protein